MEPVINHVRLTTPIISKRIDDSYTAHTFDTRCYVYLTPDEFGEIMNMIEFGMGDLVKYQSQDIVNFIDHVEKKYPGAKRKIEESVKPDIALEDAKKYFLEYYNLIHSCNSGTLSNEKPSKISAENELGQRGFDKNEDKIKEEISKKIEMM